LDKPKLCSAREQFGTHVGQGRKLLAVFHKRRQVELGY
jgi:hypothetical protein